MVHFPFEFLGIHGFFISILVEKSDGGFDVVLELAAVLAEVVEEADEFGAAGEKKFGGVAHSKLGHLAQMDMQRLRFVAALVMVGDMPRVDFPVDHEMVRWNGSSWKCRNVYKFK